MRDQRYLFVPPASLTVEQLLEVFRCLHLRVNQQTYDTLPDTVKAHFHLDGVELQPNQPDPYPN